MTAIRAARREDLAQVVDLFRAVVAPGDTYVFAADTNDADIDAYWFGPGVTSFVAVDGAAVLGIGKLVANQRDRGNHVANASFMVAPHAQGRGIGRALGEHCLALARDSGFRAMQFNFVVSTNHAAVKLWQDLGFAIVGTLPRAFRHAQLGFVDAYVMFREL